MAVFAQVLTEHNVPFSIIAEGYPDELLPYSRHIVENFSQLSTPIEVVVDCTWGPSLCDSTDDILDAMPSVPVLSSAIMSTATHKRVIFDDANVINFNGLPGLFAPSSVVELAPALGVAPDVVSFIRRYLQALGFTPEVVEDRVGLVMPRILSMIINEAAFCVMESVSSAADIDTAMKLGTNYPKGPLEWADEIGIDVVTDMLEGLKLEYAQERYRTCSLLKQLTRAGHTGKAAGKGFYTYDAQGKRLEK